MTESADKQLTQTGIAASVVAHAVLFFIMAWLMGLDQAARELWRQAHPVIEEPKVTLLFPEQILPTLKLKPKVQPQFIRTSQNEPSAEKPLKADFQSDRNTKAASREAPFPDGSAPVPTTKGVKMPTLELQNRKYQDGKLADDAAAKPAQLAPEEPKAIPVQVAKAVPTPMAKLMQEVDKADAKLEVAKLPLEVRKPDEPSNAVPTPAKPMVEAPKEPSALPDQSPSKRALDNFSPFTETASVKGTITRKGDAAVDAEDTPAGRFKSSIGAALGKKWYSYQQKYRGSVSYGYMRVRFYINRSGKAENVEFLEKADNPLMEEFTLKAIMQADYPPIPKDMLPSLDNDRFPVEYDFVIHD